MSEKFFKIKRGLNVQPTDPSTVTNPQAGDIVVDSTTGNSLKLYNDVTGTFQEIKGSGGGSKNYIENNDAEVDLTGWTVYSNSTPNELPDDFGGTPSGNLTFTRNTTNPLSGVADFKLSTTANNVQGEGVYYEFTLDQIDLAKKLTGVIRKSSASVEDGQYRYVLVSSSDNFVADFNVIRVNGEDLSGSTNDNLFQVQTDASDLNYRLCIHRAGSNAVASDVYLDEIEFGPRVVSKGAFISDWEEFTPTGSWTTNTTYTGLMRRVGDSVEIKYSISLSGAPNAVALRLDVPPNLTVDENKIQYIDNHAEVNSSGQVLNAGTARYAARTVYEESTGRFIPRIWRSDTVYSEEATITSTVPFALNNGDKINITATVPVQGWSSEAIQSEDFGGREIVVEADGSSQGSVASGTSIIFNNTNKDSAASFDGTTFITPETGEYLISASCGFTSGVQTLIQLEVNGVDVREFRSTANSGSGVVSGSSIVSLNKGDTLELVLSDSDSSSVTILNTPRQTNISITKLSSSQQILETETVAARYTSDSGQTVTNASNVTMIFEDKEYDTHNAYNSSTGEFTAPYSGYYKVSSKWLYIDANVSANNQFINIYSINGTQKDRTVYENNGNNVSNSTSSFNTTTLYMNKGDILTNVAFQTSGATVSVTTNPNDVTFSIVRIK